VKSPGLRGRLVLGATAFAAIAVAAALIAGRWVIAAELTRTDHDLVQAELAQFAGELREHGLDGVDPRESDADAVRERGALVTARTSDGDAVIDSMPAAVDAALVDRDPGPDFEVGDGTRTWLVASQRLDAGEPLSLWAARDVSATRNTLGLVDGSFVAGGAGLVLLFSAAAAVFVRVVLRPLETLRERERRMVSDAAHELRTPLAGLRGQLALARRSSGDPSAVDAELAEAELSVARLTDLASNLLELARIEEQSRSSSASVATLREAFLTAVDDARTAFERAAVHIDQRSDIDDATGEVGIDGVSFRRLTLNLLSNAVRAVDGAGEVTATLSCDARAVVLAVADDGPGMSEEFLPRAFDRFTRESADGAGSGLGLALVDALARAADGSVQIANTRPGLRVEVRLPLR
jgi:two-component system, OmpR family, sensor kinase